MTRRTHNFSPPVQGFTTSNMPTGGSGQGSRAGGKIGKFDDTGFIYPSSYNFPATAPEKAVPGEAQSKDDTDLLGRPLKQNKAAQKRAKNAAGGPSPHEPDQGGKGLRAMVRKFSCKK